MNAKLIVCSLAALMMISASMAAVPEYCLLEPVVGICHGSIDRYYYKPETGTCVLFQYGGCQGNENNFETAADCQIVCVSP